MQAPKRERARGGREGKEEEEGERKEERGEGKEREGGGMSILDIFICDLNINAQTQVPALEQKLTYKYVIIGAGTTGHAVIDLNREDGGSRKYVLVEMGEYFESVLKPRIQKITEEVEAQGAPHFSALVEQFKTNPSPEKPPTNSPDQKTYDEMLLNLMLQVWEEAKKKGVEKDDPKLLDTLVAGLKEHLVKMDEHQAKLVHVLTLGRPGRLLDIHTANCALQLHSGSVKATSHECKHPLAAEVALRTSYTAVWDSCTSLHSLASNGFLPT